MEENGTLEKRMRRIMGYQQLWILEAALTAFCAGLPSSLREIATQVYSLGEKFDPIVHSFALTKIVTKPDGNKVLSWKKPVLLGGLSTQASVASVKRC